GRRHNDIITSLRHDVNGLNWWGSHKAAAHPRESGARRAFKIDWLALPLPLSVLVQIGTNTHTRKPHRSPHRGHRHDEEADLTGTPRPWRRKSWKRTRRRTRRGGSGGSPRS